MYYSKRVYSPNKSFQLFLRLSFEHFPSCIAGKSRTNQISLHCLFLISGLYTSWDGAEGLYTQSFYENQWFLSARHEIDKFYSNEMRKNSCFQPWFEHKITKDILILFFLSLFLSSFLIFFSLSCLFLSEMCLYFILFFFYISLLSSFYFIFTIYCVLLFILSLFPNFIHWPFFLSFFLSFFWPRY